MSTKHTPGPWFRDDRSGLECDVRAASGRKVALCWGLASNNARNYDKKYKAECDAISTRITPILTREKVGCFAPLSNGTKRCRNERTYERVA